VAAEREQIEHHDGGVRLWIRQETLQEEM